MLHHLGIPILNSVCIISVILQNVISISGWGSLLPKTVSFVKCFWTVYHRLLMKLSLKNFLTSSLLLLSKILLKILIPSSFRISRKNWFASFNSLGPNEWYNRRTVAATWKSETSLNLRKSMRKSLAFSIHFYSVQWCFPLPSLDASKATLIALRNPLNTDLNP